MTLVLLRFSLRVASATALGLVLVGAVLAVVGLLDGSVVAASRLFGQVLLLSPLVASLAAGLCVSGLRVRGELVVLALSGRHPGGWSLAAAGGAGLLVGLLGLAHVFVPAEPQAVESVAVEAEGVWWRSADRQQVVRLGSRPGWQRDGDVLVGDVGSPQPSWRSLRPSVGPGEPLSALLAGPLSPDRRAWALLAMLLPALAGGGALVGGLAETMMVRGRSVAALLATGSAWLLALALTVLAARGGLPVGGALVPTVALLLGGAWLGRAEARYSATM